MSDCIFCAIVSGKLPSYKIYEDDNYLAFLDIFPFSSGHTMVIPKKHYRWVWDVEDIGGYMKVTQKIAKHFQHINKGKMVASMIFGMSVPHAHIHILPGLNDSESKLISDNIENTRRAKLLDNKALELVNKLKL